MDRVNRATLMLIAAGLWANAAVVIIHPARAADDADVVTWLGKIGTDLQAIRNDFHELVVSGPHCQNDKLCGVLHMPR